MAAYPTDIDALLDTLDTLLEPPTPPTVVERPGLSINNLDAIKQITLSPDLARCKQSPDDASAKDRLETALHEAAHFCAAVMVKSCTLQVFVNPSVNPKRRSAGKMDSCEQPEDPRFQVFVDLSGVEWDRAHCGTTNRALKDVHDAKHHAFDANGQQAIDEETAKAHRFVREFVHVIQYAAIGILCLCDAHGVLKGKRLAALHKWISRQLPNYYMFFNERAWPQ